MTVQNRQSGLAVPVESLIHGIDTEGLERSNGIHVGHGKVYGKPRRIGDIPRMLGLPGDNFTMASFARCLRDRRPELPVRLLRQLEDRPFVDIGAGSSNGGYAVARALNASCYIGVEGYFADELASSILEGASMHDEEHPAIRFSVISEDMLAALSRFPNGSANIFASSLDASVLGCEYMLKIAGQVARVQFDDGLFVNLCSDIKADGKPERLNLAVCYGKPSLPGRDCLIEDVR